MKITRLASLAGLALCACAGSTFAQTPLHLEYCVEPMGGVYKYEFRLTVDNISGTFFPGQGFGWIIFGDEPGAPTGTGVSPINDFIADPSYWPAGPFDQVQGSGGGHNGPTLGPVSSPIPPHPLVYWEPTGVGDFIVWGGFSAVDLPQGELLWSNLLGSGGASNANFVVATRVAVCGGSQPCYANCDGSTTEPVLNVDDFTCFINEYAAAQSLPHEQQVSHYANCDNSTTAPALNVDDFTCFINQYATGCP